MTNFGQILITGGTGTFGNAFTKRVLDEELADRVKIFSRDEKKQLDMRIAFNDDPRLRFYLGDVRGRLSLRRAMQGVDVIVHAAALKQVDRSALDLFEFIDTDVIGTRNVLESAHDAGVKKALILSTDKAVSSSTPYGSCKSLAEWQAVSGNIFGSCRSSAARWGNVLGSRGSVLELWAKQLRDHGVVRITDPAMTRFWLAIDEAVDLVLLALERMGGGEIFIPKGVKRMRTVDLLHEHFPDAPIEIVGKRSYEKVHELLVASEEVDRLRDCGDVYVLQPLHVRWEPGPYGADFPAVLADFQYRSDM